jgi:ATP-binding cassette, subfamily B, bacterial
VAVIGGNGDGKTTLVKLLAGLLAPTEGTITLDGRDLRDWEPSELKRHFAIVFQGFARYSMSLRDNVAIGAHLDDAKLRAITSALADSGAGVVASELPRGIETELIPGIAGGTGLSGGQWQRVAVARGIVRSPASYLVLDEPTSALDAVAEESFMERLRAGQGSKAIILITHRSSLLRPTDKVVHLEHGRLVLAGAPVTAHTLEPSQRMG